MDYLDAIMAIEGESTPSEEMEAWATLIKSGEVWSLQGFYGRGATRLIEGGYITKDGEITDKGMKHASLRQ